MATAALVASPELVAPQELVAPGAALVRPETAVRAGSVATAERTVDAFVAQVDPHAVHRTETRARGRSVDVGEEDGGGMATVYATLFAHDAKAFDARVDALARTVCPADPRTLDQRRADAVGVGGDHPRRPRRDRARRTRVGP